MHQPNIEFVGLLRGAGSRLRLANPDQVTQNSRAKRRRQGDRQLEPGDKSLSAHVPVRIQFATYLFLRVRDGFCINWPNVGAKMPSAGGRVLNENREGGRRPYGQRSSEGELSMTQLLIGSSM